MLLFVLAVIVYAPLIPRLGFYWDDWVPVQIALAPHSLHDFIRAFTGNRPLSGAFFYFLFQIFPPIPWIWQVGAVLLRVAAALLVGLWIRDIWPNNTLRGRTAAMLFLLYPAFRQQAVAVAYVPHWVAIDLVLLSLWWMIRQLNLGRYHPKYLWPSWLVMLVGNALIEYALPLEVTRWLLLFRYWRSHQQARKQILKVAIPYLLMGAFLVIYTQFSRRTDVHWPSDLHTAAMWGMKSVYSFLYTWVGAWTLPFDKGFWDDLHAIPTIISGFIAALLVGVVVSVARRTWHLPSQKDDFGKWGPLLATSITLLGLLPFWVVGRFVGKLYTDRYTLVASIGGVLFWTWVLQYFRRQVRWWALAIILSFTAFLQIQFSRPFITSWETQTSLYQQLLWRLPDLPPHTPIIGQHAIALYVDRYVMPYAINAVYASRMTSPFDLPLWYVKFPEARRWFFPSSVSETETLVAGQWRFAGKATQRVLLVEDHFTMPGCVWVLGPWDRNNPYISDKEQEAARQLLPPPGGFPPASPPMFLPSHAAPTWCYFYQQAERARQQEAWNRVWKIWQNAMTQGVEPIHPHEYALFITAALRLNEPTKALELTQDYWQRVKGTGSEDEGRYELCALWQKQDALIQERRIVEKMLQCSLLP